MPKLLESDQEMAERQDLADAVRAMPKHPRGDRLAALRTIVKDHQAARVEGLFVDVTTASMVVGIHDALNEKNQKTFAAFTLRRMVDLGWKLVSKK
jgi:hypothetical protein